jgi:hypothetical protein
MKPLISKIKAFAGIVMIMTSLIAGLQVNAQTVKEAPSTVKAKYVAMSATKS